MIKKVNRWDRNECENIPSTSHVSMQLSRGYLSLYMILFNKVYIAALLPLFRNLRCYYVFIVFSAVLFIYFLCGLSENCNSLHIFNILNILRKLLIEAL